MSRLTSNELNISDVTKAREMISAFVTETPLVYSDFLSEKCGKRIWLKLENLQPTLSFKVRPAFYGMLLQLDKAKQKGVVASSSGNFAQAVAYAAQKLGINATIVMMKKTSQLKVARTQELGAKVEFCDDTLRARVTRTDEIEKELGAVRLEPFNSIETVIGDATLGLELKKQFSENNIVSPTILVPVSGGGLIAGLSGFFKTEASVIGVQSNYSQLLSKSIEQGKRAEIEPFQTRCDALVATQLGEVPYSIIKQYVKKSINIEESNLENIQTILKTQHQSLAEFAGLAPIAALLHHKDQWSLTDDVVCIVSGGNAG